MTNCPQIVFSCAVTHPHVCVTPMFCSFRHRVVHELCHLKRPPAASGAVSIASCQRRLLQYGHMSNRSQSAGASVTNQNTVVREGHKTTQVVLAPSQTESQLYSFGSPLGATEHGGRSRVGLSQNALRALSVHQGTTGSRPVIFQGEQMETTRPFHNGDKRHFGRAQDCFSGWNNPSIYRPGLHTAREQCGDMRTDQGI